MSNFTRANPLGWAPYEELTASQINTIDENLVKCANFTDGSTHAPTAVVEVGGAGFKLTGPNLVDGGSASLTAQNSGGIRIESTGWFSLVAGATVNIAANLLFSGTPLLAGTPFLSGVLSLTGTGHIRKRVFWVSVDADFSKGINDCDNIVVPTGVISATHTCTLSTTGAADGDEITVTNLDPSNYLSVGGVSLQFAGGWHFSATFIYNAAAGAWWLKSRTPYSA